MKSKEWCFLALILLLSFWLVSCGGNGGGGDDDAAGVDDDIGDDDNDASDDDAGNDDATDDDNITDDDSTDDDSAEDDTAIDDDTADTTPPEFDGLQSAIPDDSGNIILNWNAATDESLPITYDIYLGTQSGEENFSAPLAITSDLTYTAADLNICESYFFVVRAKDAVGNEDANVIEKSAKPVNYHCNLSPEERLIWTFSAPGGPFNIETLGWINDVDGDGVPDVILESYDSRANGPNPGDHLFCLSGATGEIIWSARPANELGYGSGGWGDQCLNRSPDLNGDGFDDVLFGSAWGDRAAYAISGKNGSILWYFDSYSNPASPGSGWVYEIQSVPDITGDGVPEAAFALGSDNNSAYLVDGATGSVLWRLAASNDALESLAVLNDVNGDQVPDIAFGGGDTEETRVFCVSGNSNNIGTVLWDRDTLSSNYTMTTIRDVNDDGADEVVVGVWSYYSVPCRVMALSGKDGIPLWTYLGLDFNPPMRIVNIGDVDGDGFDDVAVSSWAEFIVAISGKTGNELWKAGTGISGDDVWAVDVIDDITGDGKKDVVAGSFSSLVYSVNGVTGQILWSYDTGDSKVLSVRGIPDVTGNCVPDVIAGTQALNQGDAGMGTVFLLEGCK